MPSGCSQCVLSTLRSTIPSKSAPEKIPITSSTTVLLGPSVQPTVIDAPPEYVLLRTLNVTPGNAVLSAPRTSFAVSAHVR